MNNRPHIAAYYFPEYHPDPRNEVWHGKGWTEWELIKRAEPRFEGHYQPRVPLWGYEDESEPRVMEKKIAVAAEHGVDSFIFDWYWYENGPFVEKPGPFLHRCLDEGFLKAKNNDRLKFSIMWANHDWANQHPGHRTRPAPLLAEGKVSRRVFEEATKHCIENYFSHPSYWRVGGGLYFSIYQVNTLVAGLGGTAATKEALEDFRARVRAAGLGELHLNAIQQSTPIDTREENFEKHHAELLDLGFDSVAAYIWHWRRLFAHFPTTDYAEAREKSIGDWRHNTETYSLPYIPNVTIGWDNSPRACPSDKWEYLGGVFTPVVIKNPPEEFEKSLRAAAEFVGNTTLKGLDERIVTINAWNEWTEGNYLEPDERYGLGYLEALKRVFGTPG